MKCIIGKKLGMTTLYDEKTGAQPVTLVECNENTVSFIRTKERDGYDAIQLSTQKTKKKTVAREFRLTPEQASNLKEIKTLSVDVFQPGDKVRVQGITKGKGFQGVVKRHGFAGAPKSHGHKHDLRMPGSIGATYPEHVPKGRRMAGRMGFDRSTVRNVTVVSVDSSKGILAIRGAVPGIPEGIVRIWA